MTRMGLMHGLAT